MTKRARARQAASRTQAPFDSHGLQFFGRLIDRAEREKTCGVFNASLVVGNFGEPQLFAENIRNSGHH